VTDIVPKGQRKAAGSIIDGLYYPAVVVLLMLGLTPRSKPTSCAALRSNHSVASA